MTSRMQYGRRRQRNAEGHCNFTGCDPWRRRLPHWPQQAQRHLPSIRYGNHVHHRIHSITMEDGTSEESSSKQQREGKNEGIFCTYIVRFGTAFTAALDTTREKKRRAWCPTILQ